MPPRIAPRKPGILSARVSRPLALNHSGPPPLSAFTRAERRVIERYRTPQQVQRFLNELPYNREPDGETLHSFRGVLRRGSAHCLEAVLTAAVILEHHGYPPTVLSFESADGLDHVLFVYRRGDRWGSVARSRDPGLHGRKPVFATARALALSYVDPYVDFTGSVTGYAVADLRLLGRYDWRLASGNVWKVERMLLDYPHRKIRTSRERISRLRRWYREYMAASGGRKPIAYRGRERWTPLPSEFL